MRLLARMVGEPCPNVIAQFPARRHPFFLRLTMVLHCRHSQPGFKMVAQLEGGARYYVRGISDVVRPVRRFVRANLLRGSGVHCPLCETSFRRFIGGELCPRCESQTRHRLLWLYLRERLVGAGRRLRLAHFAPEYCLQRVLRQIDHIEYISCDLYEPEAMLKTDITAIELPDESQDIVICSHVLEHVPDDARAMRELRRITTIGGIVIIQVPQRTDVHETYEDWRITSPKERAVAFGQFDHVRVYGGDLVDRLKSAGFAVEVVTPWLAMTDSERRCLAVWNDRIFVCRRPSA